MRNDCRGIGGFFEDLPVLLFVLAGSMLLIGTNAWITVGKDTLETSRMAEERAEDLSATFMLALHGDFGGDVAVQSVRLVTASSIGTEATLPESWRISVTVIHPWRELVLALGTQAWSSDACTGWHSQLLNLRYSVSGCAIAEVVVCVSSP
jgi:hypothetical protein